MLNDWRNVLPQDDQDEKIVKDVDDIDWILIDSWTRKEGIVSSVLLARPFKGIHSSNANWSAGETKYFAFAWGLFADYKNVAGF